MLKRQLTLFDLCMYGIGLIVGAGIYVIVGEAAFYAGTATWLAFAIAAAVSVLVGLCCAELSSAMPRAGSFYVYVKRAFGERLGFLAGWLILFETVVAASAVAIGFGYYLNTLWNVNIPVAAAALIAGLSLLNFWSMKQSSRVNTIETIIEVSGLVAVIAAFVAFTSPNISLAPNTAFGWGGLFTATTLIFFAYLGFELIATSAEEARDPRRNVPRAILISLAVSAVLYILVAMAYTSMLDAGEITQVRDAKQGPMAYAFSKHVPWASGLFTFIGLFATMNTVLIMLIGGSRLFYGMAAASTIPKWFSAVHRRTGTPYVAVAIIGIVSMLGALPGRLDLVAQAANLGALLVFALVGASVMELRKRRVSGLFRIPGPSWLIPLGAALSSAALALYIVWQEPMLIPAIIAAVIAGYGLRRLLSGKRINTAAGL